MRPTITNAGGSRIWLLPIPLIAIFLAGCGASPSIAGNHQGTAPPGARQPQTSEMAANDPSAPAAEIKIENFAFVPAEVTVKAGTRVTWVNKDDAPHTATSVDDKFNSRALDTDDKYSFVFTEKGDYAYYCALHPQMKAVIKVK